MNASHTRRRCRDVSRGRHAAVSRWYVITGLLTVAVMTTACSREPEPDAYGNVEAIEVVVSSESAGRLLSFGVEEGQSLAADAVVGAIDAVQLALERDQLAAQRAANASRVTETARQVSVLEAQRASVDAQRAAAAAQVSALRAQLDTARRNFERTERLFKQQASTSQQRDQTERDVRVLEEQIKAQTEQVEALGRQAAAYDAQVAVTRAQRDTAARQVESAEVQVERAVDRLGRAEIRNPSAGTVLATYARAGEIVQQGQPLYRIANLDEVDVRAYVAGPQLASLRIGGPARVNFDVGGGRESLSGTITWISDRAEFTPTPIQTREERADLVYAIKVRVRNEGGRLKIGMPVDVELDAPGGAQ
jgi:HlyD family secretion protein